MAGAAEKCRASCLELSVDQAIALCARATMAKRQAPRRTSPVAQRDWPGAAGHLRGMIRGMCRAAIPGHADQRPTSENAAGQGHRTARPCVFGLEISSERRSTHPGGRRASPAYAAPLNSENSRPEAAAKLTPSWWTAKSFGCPRFRGTVQWQNSRSGAPTGVTTVVPRGRSLLGDGLTRSHLDGLPIICGPRKPSEIAFAQARP